MFYNKKRGLYSFTKRHKKKESQDFRLRTLFKKKAVTYSPALHCSTIGASGLNFSVRNGKRWDTTAIAT